MQRIYNSRNYNGVLNAAIMNGKVLIYNSRNYNGVLNSIVFFRLVYKSTIVEIITEY